MNRRVYSTEVGRICPDCNHALTECRCKSTKLRRNSTSAQRSTQHSTQHNNTVRITRETKGRKGAGVTLVSGLALADGELKALAKKLRQHCGSGGSIKAGVIEVQGDHRERIKSLLADIGIDSK